MTLFENERNGKYETDHIHMFLNGQIEIVMDKFFTVINMLTQHLWAVAMY